MDRVVMMMMMMMMMVVVMELLNMMIGGLSADSDPIVAGDVSKQSRPTLASYTTTYQTQCKYKWKHKSNKK